jgi:hypothetical protein
VNDQIELAANPTVHFWRQEIVLYDRNAEKWVKRVKKILRRYKDNRTPREEAVTRFNTLWSTVQTRLPALYARDPKPQVERRYKDKDPVGRTSAEILERSIEYTLEHCNPTFALMRQAVLDFELGGRGVLWARYCPHFKKVELDAAKAEKRPKPEPPVDERGEPMLQGGDQNDRAGKDNEEIRQVGASVTMQADDEVEEQTLAYEETLWDYVYWEDFGHTWARTWEEVRAVWRRVYMTREELKERFKGILTDEEIASIPLDWQPKGLKDEQIKIDQKRATVYEIWDRQNREVLWISKNFGKELDKRPDQYGLKDFFPCPRPLLANLANDEIIPTPNFTFYHDQAQEVDELSTRINAITKALKVAGVYDKAAAGVDRLLSEGIENQLVPVDGFMALKEKGGLAGVIELLPVKEIAETLSFLREQRQTVLDDIYQLMGTSDIVRGMSDPNETATAQQLKGKFSVLRIQDAQWEVQRFARDVVRITGEMVADYDIDTLKAISGVKLLTAAEKALVQLQAQPQPAAAVPQPGAGPAGAGGPPAGPPQGMAGPGPQGSGGAPTPMAGQVNPQAPAQPQQPAPGQQPAASDKTHLLNEPTWEEVAALLENPVLREFRIDIETDSTIRMQEDEEKQGRVEFLTTLTGFLKEAGQVGAAVPQMIPALGELTMWGMRAFKTGRTVERVLEDAIDQLKVIASQPKPDPEMQKEQARQAKEDQIRNQLEAQRAQHQETLEAQKNQMQAQLEAQLEEQKRRFEAERVQYETAAKERIAQADNAAKIQIEQMRLTHEATQRDKEMAHEKDLEHIKGSHAKELAKMQPQKEAA